MKEAHCFFAHSESVLWRARHSRKSITVSVANLSRAPMSTGGSTFFGAAHACTILAGGAAFNGTVDDVQPAIRKHATMVNIMGSNFIVQLPVKNP